jgi:hypothetical protein
LPDRRPGASVELMNYVHCAACRCAYDAAASRRCPNCGQKLGTGAGSIEDEVADASAQLARALARATPAELDALVARIAHTIGPAEAAEPIGSMTRGAPAPAPVIADGSGPHVAPTMDQWAAVVLGAVGGAVADARGLAIATVEPPRPPAPPPAPPALRALVTSLVVAVAAPARAALRRRATGLIARARRAFALP